MQHKHAIVVGSGMAGLIAARVLHEYFTAVTVMETDTEFKSDLVRKGTPQASQPHVLLMRGKETLFRLFPDLEADFDASGVPSASVPQEIRRMGPYGEWEPRYETDLVIRLCTRPFLERKIRDRVEALPNVSFATGTTVTGLEIDMDRLITMGVFFQSADAGKKADNQFLEADLVVDATGRRSGVGKWLENAGLEAPDVSRVPSGEWYASRLFQLRPKHRSWKVTYIPKAVPQKIRERGAFVGEMENGLHIVNLIGGKGDKPPTTDEKFLEFARQVEGDSVYQELVEGTPVTPISFFSNFDNICLRVDKMKVWPRGLIVMGDSACRFNPVYGQGMTCAIFSAYLLRRILRARKKEHDKGRASSHTGWEQEYHRRLIWILENPWLLATREGLETAPLSKQPPGRARTWLRSLKKRLNHLLVSTIYKAMFIDQKTHLRFVKAQHMLEPVAGLFDPGVFLRALYFRIIATLKGHQPTGTEETAKNQDEDTKTAA